MKTKKNGFSPPKGFNTRQKLKEANQAYVRLLCEALRKKIQSEWAEKWRLHHFGSSLEECCQRRRYSAFIHALNNDIVDKCCQQGYSKNGGGLSKSCLERLLKCETPAGFLQNYTCELLSVYLGCRSWEHFKERYAEQANCLTQRGDSASPAEPLRKSTQNIVNRRYLH